MPMNPDGTFSRVWKFVDHREAGEKVTRVDLDVSLDDLVLGISEALTLASAGLTEEQIAAAVESYLDEVTGARDRAETAATAAEGDRQDAQVAAQSASTAYSNADLARATAEAARDAAILGVAGVYGTIVSGLAATTDGQRFIVATASGWKLYLNDGGTEDALSGDFPSLTALNSLLKENVRIQSVSQGRPAELLERYTVSKIGNRSTGLESDGAVVAAPAPYGRALDVGPARVVAMRDRIALNTSAQITVRAVFRMQNNPCDPEGEAIIFGIEWLDSSYASVGAATIYSAVTWESDGWKTIEATIDSTGITLVDAGEINDTGVLTPPATASYAVPFIQTNGTDGVTRIAVIEAREAAMAMMANRLTFPQSFILPPEILPEIPPALITSVLPEALPEIPPALITEIPPEALPPDLLSKPVARTFYVTADGDDANDGDNLNSPLATVTAAIAKMAAEGVPCVTIIHPGTYVVPPDTEMPEDCTLYGVDTYAVRLNLPGGQEENNMLLLDRGCKVRGITFGNLRHEAYDGDPTSATFAPPRKGFAVAFKPGAFITRLPYVMDCAVRAPDTSNIEIMTRPTDRANGNPLMPRGAGCMIADPSVIDPNSPQKLMAAFSFTSVNPNGISYVALEDSFLQIVSGYTNFARMAGWSHNGGQMTFKNGDCTFGDYSFASTGFRRAIRIPDNIVTAPAADLAQADAIRDNRAAILANAETRWEARGWWAGLTADQKAFTRRDAGTLVDYIEGDRRSGQSFGVQLFTKGLFDWNAEYVFNPALLSAFIESFADIQAAIVSVTSTSATPLATLIGVVTTVLSDPATYRQSLGSRVLAQPHGMTNCGAGVNYNSLPFEFGGTGFVPDPDETIVEKNGGTVNIMWMREQGDMRLARDLNVNAARSVIEGAAFERSVQNITLPLILALGGLGGN